MNRASPEFTLEHDNAWIASSCALCYARCSIRVHRVDGVVTKIEGNPESAVGKGRLCGKGVSGIMTQYDSGIQRDQHHGPDRAQRNAASATPRDIARKIQSDAVNSMKSPDLSERIRNLYMDQIGSSPEEFDSFIKAKIEKWEAVVKISGAMVD